MTTIVAFPQSAPAPEKRKDDGVTLFMHIGQTFLTLHLAPFDRIDATPARAKSRRP